MRSDLKSIMPVEWGTVIDDGMRGDVAFTLAVEGVKRTIGERGEQMRGRMDDWAPVSEQGPVGAIGVPGEY